MTRILSLVAAAFTVALAGAQQPPAQTPPPGTPPQQPSQIEASIVGDGGAPPRFAVPDFIALTKDAEIADAAQTLSRVLFDDLGFEREFQLIPRDVYRTIPAATSMYDVPFDRWREVNADGVVIGTVRRGENGISVDVRVFNVRSRQSPFAKEYSSTVASVRRIAHTVADEIHLQMRGLKGVARTRLTFNSDRDGERVSGTIENRGSKEIYVSDYDGELQRRVTVGFNLNINSVWSPDAQSIAYTSFRRDGTNIFVSHLFKGLPPAQLTKSSGQSWLPSWSPDGSRIAFASTRDGQEEIYVMNRDGSNVRRLTNNPANDGTPTWSPSGTQIAFRSDRSGAPEIYIMGADGLGVQKLTSEGYADRPSWSVSNEIAYAARTGPGNDIKVVDLGSRVVRQLTFGEGTNESPSFAPNGRHIAFASTRSGRAQIFVIHRDGTGLKQITRAGNNWQPDWSRQ